MYYKVYSVTLVNEASSIIDNTHILLILFKLNFDSDIAFYIIPVHIALVVTHFLQQDIIPTTTTYEPDDYVTKMNW